MDRAMVYTETENDRNVYFIANVPFEIIPEGFIMALKDVDFVPMEYYANCKSYNESEYYWNIMGLTKSGIPVVFVWGVFDKLEKMICINRISIHPKWQSCNKDLMVKVVKTINEYARDVGANFVFTITKKADAHLRKLKEIMRKSDCTVLEIIEGVY